MIAAEALATAPAFAPRASIGAFVVFCRIGGCLMLAPGFSNSQIPTQIRLFVALAVTLALTPLLFDKIPAAALGDDPLLTLKLIAVEFLVGGMIGFLARIFFAALETLAAGAAQMLGFANPFGLQIEAGEALPPLATLVSLAAMTLMFVADLHWELLRGLVASYDVVPVGADFNARLALREVADAFGEVVPPDAEDRLALCDLCADRQSDARARQPAHPADPDLLCRHALHRGGRAGAALFHRPAGDRSLSHRLCRLARLGLIGAQSLRRRD